MDLQKAIEIVGEAAYGHSMTLNDDFYDALRLLLTAARSLLQLQAALRQMTGEEVYSNVSLLK